MDLSEIEGEREKLEEEAESTEQMESGPQSE
jgi:hypothetical protein